jgi:hypothetical protein
MNLVLENVQPSHIPVFRELAKVLNIKMRKEESLSNLNKMSKVKSKNIV